MKQTNFSHQVVEFIPELLDDGILYVSKKYGTAVHKCACGCGEEVVTPLNPTDWSIRFDKGGPSLYPSIGNWSYKCESHYLILNGNVVWAGRWSPEQIALERERDLVAKQDYFETVNRRKQKSIFGFWKYTKAVWRRWIGKLGP